ncbi:MAG: LicD family protein [Pseudomonadota bacterium]
MPKLIRPRRPPVQKRPLSDTSWQVLHDIDALLLDRETRDQHSYKSIRRRLNSVPRAQRGLDWTERVVALYCVKGMRLRRCAALKINIRNRRMEQQEEAEFEAFAERLRQTIAPMVLTNHGMLLPFAHRDQDEVAQDLVDLFALLDRLGYPSFINSGTLLGAVREGAFLGHDDDADLAVLIDGATDEDVVTSLHKLCEDLNATGELLKPAWFHPKGPIVKVLVGSGVEVDLFPLWLRDNKAFIWPHTFADLTKDDIFPLSTQKLCGTEMPAPLDAEKMLAVNYGENWRVPDPDYFFPWGEAKLRFASVLDIYVKKHGKRSTGQHLRDLFGIKRV